MVRDAHSIFFFLTHIWGMTGVPVHDAQGKMSSLHHPYYASQINAGSQNFPTWNSFPHNPTQPITSAPSFPQGEAESRVSMLIIDGLEHSSNTVQESQQKPTWVCPFCLFLHGPISLREKHYIDMALCRCLDQEADLTALWPSSCILLVPAVPSAFTMTPRRNAYWEL